MFESVTELTQEQVQWLDNCAKGSWSLNHQTGLVDVKGGFDCYDEMISDFKGVKFGVVDGDFRCSYNRHTSLDGAPREVKGNFRCSYNRLTSLVGAPLKVGGDFYCSYTALTSLVGSPQNVGGRFVCDNNRLISLEGSPLSVGGDFNCTNNRLTSLEGAPLKVGGRFDCENNPVSEETLKTIFTKMQKGTSYLAAVESLWIRIPQDDQVLLYSDAFKWVSPEQSRGIVALRAYQDLRGML